MLSLRAMVPRSHIKALHELDYVCQRPHATDPALPRLPPSNRGSAKVRLSTPFIGLSAWTLLVSVEAHLISLLPHIVPNRPYLGHRRVAIRSSAAAAVSLDCPQ
jgi:hypothetical protein